MTKQKSLEIAHADLRTLVQLWVDKLITDKELCNGATHIGETLDHKIVGQLDPNSGLRY